MRCGPCGPSRANTGAARRPSRSRLYRDPANGRIAGVCAGLAEYLGVSALLIRIVFIFGLIMFTVPTLIAYILAGVLLPVVPEGLYASQEEETFWRDVRTDPRDTATRLRHKFRELEAKLAAMERYVTSQEFELNREFRDLER